MMFSEKISNLLKNQRFAVIATQDTNGPYTNLVSFLVDNNFKKIYFPTSRKTKKYQNLSKNSRISVLIDNRVNKPLDIKDAIVITAIGKSKGNNQKEIKNEFLKKHPYLKEFIFSNDCIIIEVSIEKFIFVDNFKNVTEYNLL